MYIAVGAYMSICHNSNRIGF